MRVPGIACLLACSVIASALSPSPSRAADEVTEINRLVRQGNQPQALKRIEAHLAKNPGDVKIRFLKGIILTERGNTAEAITAFSMLTKDYPDLPEPHNNLAVLYASRGEYDKARAALETAIRLNPGYAVAYENLGDIHAKLASQAYEKSRQLDKSNAASQTKIEIIRGLFVGQTGPTPGPKKGNAQRPEAPKLAALDPAKSEPASTSGPRPKSKTAADPPKLTPLQQAPAAAAPAAPKPAADATEVIAVLNRWAEAWTKQGVSAYLAFYAPDFKVPSSESRARWEAGRRARINKPRNIEVTIIEPEVSFSEPDRAVVSFQQHYRSDTLDERVNKRMVFTKKDGGWSILEEHVLK